jgi:hypothetical protein
LNEGSVIVAKRVLGVVGVLAVCGLACGESVGQSVEVVALSGEVSPNGEAYSSFGVPTMAGDGRAVFRAFVGSSPADEALVAAGVGGDELLVLEGDLVAGGGVAGGGSVLSLDPNPGVNGAGDVAFRARLTGVPFASDRGIFVRGAGDGVIEAVAVEGEESPFAGLFYRQFSVGQNVPPVVTLNGAGQTAFLHEVEGTSGGLMGCLRVGWMGSSGSRSRGARFRCRRGRVS